MFLSEQRKGHGDTYCDVSRESYVENSNASFVVI